MKKIIVAALLAAALSATLASCGEKHTCEKCQDTFRGDANIVDLAGTEIVFCDKCFEEYNEAYESVENQVGDIMDGLGDLDFSGENEE